MNQEDRSAIVSNYYKASNALMDIGMTKDIPDELKQLVMMASVSTVKIIDFINSHRE